jgi:transcriptional antiterminator RfaH
MTPRLLTTQEAAERLGLTPGSLQKLRWQEDGLPIFQQGLNVHYRLEDLEAFEQREVRALLKQVLQHERPLPLIRSIARSLDLVVNTQGVESEPTVFKPAAREDLKPAPKVKTSASVLAEQDKPKAAAKPEIKPVQNLTLPTGHSWYLVHTKGRQEDTAITNLQRQNFRCYMPMLYVEKVRRGKPAVVAEPMFPSYVFVQLDTSDNIKGQSWSPIRSTLGVRDLVKFGGHPAKVDADLITALYGREQLQQSNPQALFAAGDKVVITDGPFAGIEAIYQTADAEQRSMILLSMLNKPVAMRIEPGKLRKCG